MDQAAGPCHGLQRNRNLSVELPFAGTQAATPTAAFPVAGPDARSTRRGPAQGHQLSPLPLEPAGIQRLCAAPLVVRIRAARIGAWPLLPERTCIHGFLSAGVLFCRPRAGKSPPRA